MGAASDLPGVETLGSFEQGENTRSWCSAAFIFMCLVGWLFIYLFIYLSFFWRDERVCACVLGVCVCVSHDGADWCRAVYPKASLDRRDKSAGRKKEKSHSWTNLPPEHSINNRKDKRLRARLPARPGEVLEPKNRLTPIPTFQIH